MISTYIIVFKGGKSQHKVEQKMWDDFRGQNYSDNCTENKISHFFFLLLLYNPVKHNGDERGLSDILMKKKTINILFSFTHCTKQC